MHPPLSHTLLCIAILQRETVTPLDTKLKSRRFLSLRSAKSQRFGRHSAISASGAARVPEDAHASHDNTDVAPAAKASPEGRASGTSRSLTKRRLGKRCVPAFVFMCVVHGV